MNVVVANITYFQQGILKELMLDGQVVLPTVRHLIAGLTTDACVAEPLPEAGRRASTRLIDAVDEASIGRGEVANEWRIGAADLQGEQAIAVKVLAGAGPDSPFALSSGIVGQAQTWREHMIVVVPECPVRTRCPAGSCGARIGL